jgi:hypothetical protein
MNFNNAKVVDIPAEARSNNDYRELINLLITNIGKAMEFPTDGRSINAFRTSVRSHLNRTGQNKLYTFHSVAGVDGQTITMWLNKIEQPEVKA